MSVSYIVRSAETVLEISDIIQFARLVFEYESYKGTMSSARQTGDDGAVASSRDTMPAELPQSMQTQRCIPVRRVRHRASDFVSIDILLSFIYDLGDISLFCIYHIINKEVLQ